MSDCNPSCLITIASTDFDYGGCGLISAIRSGFIKNFIGLRCDETIPDITDETAIAAQVAAGTLFASPTLAEASIGEATLGGEITENCQPPQATQRDYPFTWRSYRVDKCGLTDFEVWNRVDQSLTSWTIAPVTCDNIILVPQDFATNGVFFDMRGIVNTIFPNENSMYYSGSWTFRYNYVLNGVILTQAVISALGLSGFGLPASSVNRF